MVLSSDKEIRWQLRYKNFSKAIILLREALEKKRVEEYSRLEQEGIVQRFEYTFELGWKTLKDKLQYEGYDEKTPRSVIRRAFEVGYLTEEEAETWLEALNHRNLLSHTYDETMALEALNLIAQKYYPKLHTLYDRLSQEIHIDQ